MAIIAKNEQGGSFEPIPEGVHTAICVSIIDLGMQYSEKWDKSTHKAMVTWELPEETYTKDGETKPRTLSKEYSLSLGEKSNLRKDLQAWRGRAFTDEELAGFDLKNVLGKGCQIQLIHTEKNGNKYANIASIMGLPKGMKLDEPSNIVYFDLGDTECMKLMAQIPEWIQNKIKESDDYKNMVLDSDLPVAGDEEDVPF